MKKNEEFTPEERRKLHAKIASESDFSKEIAEAKADVERARKDGQLRRPANRKGDRRAS
jgi:hypothetical protein